MTGHMLHRAQILVYSQPAFSTQSSLFRLIQHSVILKRYIVNKYSNK